MSFIYNSEENFLKEAINKKVICFGAGDIFRRFLEYNKSLGVDIECVIDNDVNKQGSCVSFDHENIAIQSPDYLKQYEENKILLITSSAVLEIKKQLSEKSGIKHIFAFPFSVVYPKSMEERKQIRLVLPALKMMEQYGEEFQLEEKQKQHLGEKIEDKCKAGIVVPYMTTLITSGCTLRCRDCNNLMPYYSRGSYILTETILQDVNRICDAVDFCICMNITGGEPFLHPELNQIINTIKANDKIAFVEIITNGTLLPSHEVIMSLKNEKTIVKISNYHGYSRISELTRLFKNEGIRFMVKENLRWIDSGGIERRNKEYEQTKYEYLSCWAGKFCKSIYNGKLYVCARAAFLHELGISDHQSDYLDLTGPDLRERLLGFYLQEYVDACDFCDHADLEHKKVVEAAIQCH